MDWLGAALHSVSTTSDGSGGFGVAAADLTELAVDVRCRVSTAPATAVPRALCQSPAGRYQSAIIGRSSLRQL